jgi:predicted metal-dependent hydrolase
VREVAAKHREELTQQYASGATLQVRGRWSMLDVAVGAVPEVAITCRSKVHVVVPRDLPVDARGDAIRRGIDGWLRARAQTDIERLGRRHEATLGVVAAGYRLSDAKARWGSCGRDGVVRIHWRLAQAPAATLDYVVAHEVAHLRHRHHAPAFWATLGRALPDWRERKMALERWEGAHRRL